MGEFSVLRFGSNLSEAAECLSAILAPLKEVAVPDAAIGDGATNVTDESNDTDSATETTDLLAIRQFVQDYVRQASPQVGPVAADSLFANRVELRAFTTRLQRRWRHGLRLLDCLGQLAFEIGAEENARCCEQPDSGDSTPHVLLRLHARGCLVFREVMTLLRAGYADGANGRWRTLHELAITALFISQEGADVARRYLDHEGVESWKAAEEYGVHCKALGFEPLPTTTLEALQRQKEHLVSRYGPPFLHAYGWAAAALKRADRFGLPDLERAIDVAHLRPFYRLASHGVHAAAKGLTFSMAQPFWPATVRLAGPSNAGLADPGQCAALSLLQLTTPLLTREPSLDGLVLLELLQDLAERAAEALHTAHEQLESEEAAKSPSDPPSSVSPQEP